MPNEMQLLAGIAKRKPELIKTLNILPSNGVNFLFDPSSYGQYFGGTHAGHQPGFTQKSHIVGDQIINENINPIMIENKPLVLKDGKTYSLVNLHIHSKKTKLFLK
jgi:hypothetical protein